MRGPCPKCESETELVITDAERILGVGLGAMCSSCARRVDAEVDRLEKRWSRARDRGNDLARQKPHGGRAGWFGDEKR